MEKQVTIIGGGLAGAEAAWQLAERGVRVRLIEMRPTKQTAVHKTGLLAELVCSNSLKSLDATSASGALKYELASLGSKLLQCAIETRVAAGGALAVDREAFAERVTSSLSGHDNIEIVHDEYLDLPALVNSKAPCIIATGPLTSNGFEEQLVQLIGEDSLAFFDAAAPIVEADSLDFDQLFSQSRYDKSGSDYLNAALTKEQYDLLIEELISGKKTISKEFETKELFQACQPVEEVARAGADTLRHGALKPVGLVDPKTGRRPWAVVQLRAENSNRTAYNLVGFQTNLTFSEQQRIFSLIPGLENAVFSRFGVMHRNTFINSPQVLSKSFSLKSHPNIRFAGQITGTEGYVEAMASGLFAALNTYAELLGEGREPSGEQTVSESGVSDGAVILPEETLSGSLFAYATDPHVVNYQPMHVNYGIIKPLDDTKKKKKERYAAYSERSRAAIEAFKERQSFLSFLPAYEVPFLVP
jgi:methylenetetrahydrofolate--tRNA-(uracil-5-)-methyltransferase